MSDANVHRESNAQPQELEIDVMEIARVLYRWRWLILSGFLAGLILSLIYSLVVPEKFEYQGLIEIGRVPKSVNEPNYIVVDSGTSVGSAFQLMNEQLYTQYVEPPNVTSDRLTTFSQIVYDALYEEGKSKPSFALDTDFEIEYRGNSGVFYVRVEAARDDRADVYLNKVLEMLTAEYNELESAYAERAQEDLEFLEERLMILDRLLRLGNEHLENGSGNLKKMKTITRDTNERTGGSLGQMSAKTRREEVTKSKRQLLSDINDTKKEMFEVQSKLHYAQSLLDYTRPTRIAVPPRNTGKRVSPRYGLYSILGTMVGGFVMLIFSFFLDFWKRNKNEIVT